jgi:hypothetical protein
MFSGGSSEVFETEWLHSEKIRDAAGKSKVTYLEAAFIPFAKGCLKEVAQNAKRNSKVSLPSLCL